MEKKCFKCRQVKMRTEFYRHPKMGDGLLGKCKECTKRDTADRVSKLSTNPDWVEYERERCRIKQRKCRLNGTDKKTTQARKKAWEERNIHKKTAQSKAHYAKRRGVLKIPNRCEVCESTPPEHMHHHDYSRPLDVVWVCTKCHGVLHRKTKFEPIGNRTNHLSKP